MPTVSVIIPTFNRSKLVINAIRSVLRQTYRDYELIVVDDGSTDDTPEALKPYMDRIRYVHQPNLGASAAQNRGGQLARGKWISILASDDVWLPTKLEAQLKAVASLGKDFRGVLYRLRVLWKARLSCRLPLNRRACVTTGHLVHWKNLSKSFWRDIRQCTLRVCWSYAP